MQPRVAQESRLMRLRFRTCPGEPGVPPTALAPTFRLPPARQPRAPAAVFLGPAGQSCSSARLQKFPGCSARPPGPQGKSCEARSLGAGPLTHRSSCRGAPAPRGASRGCRLRLPLSCGARSRDCSERVSGERRGGKVAPGSHAAGLRLRRRRLPPPPVLQCRAGAAWREYTRCAGGSHSHGARGRRAARGPGRSGAGRPSAAAGAAGGGVGAG